MLFVCRWVSEWASESVVVVGRDSEKKRNGKRSTTGSKIHEGCLGEMTRWYRMTNTVQPASIERRYHPSAWPKSITPQNSNGSGQVDSTRLDSTKLLVLYFDTPPTYEKTPPCPNGFIREDETYRIIDILSEWSDFTRRGKYARNMRPAHAAVASTRGSLNVGRFYFRVRAVLSEPP